MPRYNWRFKSGAQIVFAHITRDSDCDNWQGSQIPLICFDELTHFTQYMFFYMLSRNRSTSGVKPYVRATCNPDADSWVADFIAWYLLPNGYPDMSKAGVIRHFARRDKEIIWGNTAQEVLSQNNDLDLSDVKTFTFVPAVITDNQALLKANPQYIANLKALSTVERERLLMGNWKIRAAAGLVFPRDKANIITTLPTNIRQVVRRWDLAATVPSEYNPDPDWTAGVKMAITQDNKIIVLDVQRFRKMSNDVRQAVRQTAIIDGTGVQQKIAQDPGQAGKEQAESYIRDVFSGFSITIERESGDKVTRADPLASQWQAGNVYLMAGEWNFAYLSELDGFPDVGHDDQVDASSGAYSALVGSYSGLVDYYKNKANEVNNGSGTETN